MRVWDVLGFGTDPSGLREDPSAGTQGCGRWGFVDASPGQLRQRRVQGEIYPADQVARALDHFFRADNLTMLRELALRFLAGEPEEEFATYLARLRRHARRDTADRMLAGVAPGPGAEALIRRAARIAAGIDADLDVVPVTSQSAGRHEHDDSLVRLRQVADDVGGIWRDLDADE